MIEYIAGGLLSAITAVIAVKKKKLTFNAGLVATVAGALTYVWGGGETWAALIAFFISAAITARFKERVDPESANQARKVSQVLANGFPAVLFAAIYYFTDDTLFRLSSVSVVACAAADTWSSDIGVLSKRKTVSILTFKQIEAGQSGGISPLGCVSCVLGASFVAGIYVAAFFFKNGGKTPLAFSFAAVVLCGAIGSFADSALGAGVQAKYRCRNKITENRAEDAKLVSGFRIIDNDAVNLLSGFIAGGISVAARAAEILLK
ncbi:MAG: DUF92 domain-containing protein [Oscillospiraceae bacterium]|jgi:uncharacterized protein (TIGR00297 family)|nr:DUF92 domain-containing protein [Oscillospiraceae bacterium]